MFSPAGGGWYPCGMRALAFFGLMLLPLAGHAATLTLQDGVNGYAGTDDTYLSSGLSATSKFGSQPQMLIGWTSLGSSTDRGLIRFDVSSLAGTYISINSIQLVLSGSESYFGNFYTLHEISEANGDWVENAVSWNEKATGVSWSGGVGLGTTGYGATIASASGAQSSPVLTFNITDPAVATALINDFLTGNNQGFLVQSIYEDGSAQGMSNGAFATVPTAEGSTISQHPKLVIDYTAVPEPSTASFIIGGMALFAVRRRRA